MYNTICVDMYDEYDLHNIPHKHYFIWDINQHTKTCLKCHYFSGWFSWFGGKLIFGENATDIAYQCNIFIYLYLIK